jgi:antitoxin MazE
MRVKFRKSWSGALVRIPASVIQAAQIEMDQVVDVRGEWGRIIIEPVPPAQFVLGDMIAAITSKNRHDEVGAPLGSESL